MLYKLEMVKYTACFDFRHNNLLLWLEVINMTKNDYM